MTATPDTAPQTEAPADLDRAARRVDTAMERDDQLDPAAKKVAHDLKAALEEFHREGLVRIVRALKDDPAAKQVLFGLVDDPVVYALLVMHGIVRADPTTTAQRALEEVRPYLASHGGGVELVSVELPVARVRLSGACNGCSQSASTLREVVERALVAAVQGLQQVEVVPAEPTPSLVPLASVGLRPGAAPPSEPAAGPSEAAGWTRGPLLDELRDARVTLWRPAGQDGDGDLAGTSVPDDSDAIALVRVGQAVAAYRNACAHQGMSLERGMVDTDGCVLTCAWHGMKYQALTGECISITDKRLTAYPVRVDGGVVWLRLR